MSVQAGAITARTVTVFLLATWPRRIVLGLVLLVPIVIAAAGGFGKTEPRSFALQAGESVDLGPLTMRPTAFFVSDETERDGLEYTDGAEAWLGVIVEVENTTTSSISLTFPGPASHAIMPELPEGQLLTDLSVASEAFRIADYTDGRRTLPSVPTEVALLWEISDPEAIGDTLTATMTEQVWTYGPMSGEESWMSLGDIWTVELPRTELPPSMFEPEEEQ